mmetsp:Transcript_49115/g.147874  ORF Transcript_49115/g.147874 Transcript_49115/m.147874 type:complete len:97 (-) Transcript_49115:173-463(-)
MSTGGGVLPPSLEDIRHHGEDGQSRSLRQGELMQEEYDRDRMEGPELQRDVHENVVDGHVPKEALLEVHTCLKDHDLGGLDTCINFSRMDVCNGPC